MTNGTYKMQDTEGATLAHPEIETVPPNGTDTGNLCPEPQAIVRFFFNQSSSNAKLEQHLRECADCRLKFEALKEAFRLLRGKEHA
jgi:hypothetical protein